MPPKVIRDQMAYEAWLKALGKRIARQRARLGWTQAKTAENIGVDMKFYQDIEYGRRPISTRTLFHLAQGMEISVRALIPQDSFEMETENSNR